ncbi:MAG TPA: peptidylprolyl isomerase [Isosphaeraceae bacterium]|jgi:foldase protein PrsA|nr:peptidylprolyl isomerase [Isosphaeraceae bacterium]
MIAMERRRTIVRCLVALAAAGALAMQPALGQQRKPVTTPAASQPDQGKASPLDKLNSKPVLVPTAIPVNPDDPVAKVNGQAISRRQLADECVSRRGKEILDTLIARVLIEQGLKAKGLEVTPAEVDREIDRQATEIAHVSREAWLRSLDKERGISPIQYAHDIVYPSLALRKLAAPMVQVTPQDLQDAFEAQYGAKLKIRLIMVPKLHAAQEIWEELKKNPAAFEKLAQTRSIDMTTASLGGLVGEPLTRHAYPRTVSDAAFLQLVDGDSKDTNPAHKPKDSDFSGPIQVNETSWVILRREAVIPGTKANLDDPNIRRMLNDMMYEAKVKSKMGEVYQDLVRGAAIVNVLTGQEKMAHEEEHPEHRVDGDVQLMSNPNAAVPAVPGAPVPSGAAAAAGVKPGPDRAPSGVPAEAAKTVEALKRPLKQKAATPATTASPSGGVGGGVGGVGASTATPPADGSK